MWEVKMWNLSRVLPVRKRSDVITCGPSGLVPLPLLVVSRLGLPGLGCPSLQLPRPCPTLSRGPSLRCLSPGPH